MSLLYSNTLSSLRIIPLSSEESQGYRFVVAWLFTMVMMVALMMVIGAITRITESGLSMVEWRPLLGTFPPITNSEWQRVFSLYQDTSQYQLQNFSMNIEQFKTIFWWEYIHRLWGRLIGLVFAVPMVWILIKRWAPSRVKPHLFILLLLGGSQAVIGWWMVRSGFVDRVEVSPIRLLIHGGMAYVIIAYLLHVGLSLLRVAPIVPASSQGWCLGALTVSIFATIILGILVAGGNAGMVFNHWPMMTSDQQWIPDSYTREGLFTMDVWLEAHYVQTNHRWFAYLTFVLAMVSLWLWRRPRKTDFKSSTTSNGSLMAIFVAATITMQAFIGIFTVVLVVPMFLAVAHQIGALVLFLLIHIWLHKVWRGRTLRLSQ